MIEEIIKLYEKQYDLYMLIDNIIKDTQSVKDNEQELETYFSKIIQIFNEINDIDLNLNTLKKNYVSDKHVMDFTGQMIKSNESEVIYKKFSDVLEKLSNIIIKIKREHDELLVNIKTKNVAEISKIAEETNKKYIHVKYKNSSSILKSKYLDSKK